MADFRNYEAAEVKLSPGINVLYGDNGQGKTNILEAVYISASTKSHRGSPDRELIRISKNEAHIKTGILRSGITNTIDIHIKSRGSKGIAVNRAPIKRASDLFGVLNAVIFAPEDLDIVKSGPDRRRKFMDMELCQLDKVYLSDLTNYNKVLVNRSKLLKSLYDNRELYDTLDVWDEQLIKYGSGIINRRDAFLNELSTIVEEKYHNISGSREKLNIRYKPDVSISDLPLQLSLTRERDIRFGMNNVGPHRDDIEFTVDGKDLRKYGSQGQKRSASLALKLSEVELVRRLIKDDPVLLLDDVLSELDKNRQYHLLSEIKGIQTVMTCPAVSEIKNDFFMIDKIFYVNAGMIRED